MTRKLIRLAIASACFMPVGALPLGLGPIQVYSSLNQTLDAQVELLSPETQGQLTDLSVKLAAPQAFEQAGIERSALLSDLGFSVQTRPDGRNIVKITSQRPIREPSLNFLIELGGPAGRLIREYAILLDPPQFGGRTPVSSNTTSARPVPPSVNDKPRSAPPMPSPRATYDGKTYGPVAPGENLWRIANRVRPDSVSPDQMMQALLKANPRAFLQPNIDTLMAGVMLRIPTVQEIAASGGELSQGAIPQQIAQTVQPANAPVRSVEESAPGPAQVRLLAPEILEEQEQTASEINPMEISPQAAAGSAPPITAPFPIRLDGDGVKLRVATSDDLQARLNVLMAVDQAALTAVQKTVEETPEQENPAETAVTPKPEEELTTAPEEEGLIETNSASGPVDESAVPTPSMPLAEQSAPPVEVVESGSSDGVQESIPTGEPVLVADILSAVTDDPKTMAVTGFGSLLFIGLIALLVRRIRGIETAIEYEDDTDESLSSAPVDVPATATVMEEAVASGSPPSQTGLPSKPVSTAVDYLERVDLLIAVGNLREAENTVRLALAEDPVNTGLAAKLLDIQFARGNADGFREEAERLRDMMEDTADPLWQHVVQMGRKLRPGDSLFGGISEPSSSTSIAENTTPAMASAGDDEDLDLQLKRLYGQAQPAGRESLVSGVADLGDTQPEESEEEEISPVSTPLETSQDTVAESFDLDWQSPALESPAAESEQLEAEEDLEDRLQALDFDLEELAGPKPPVQARADEEETEDFGADLQTLDFDLEKAIEQDHGTMASPMEDGLADEGYVETKLDLALAYLDMEDPVGARTLLEEVLQEGGTAQKQRAAELMQRLDVKEEEEPGKVISIKAG